jgi:teichuronic acid biosynthesis glycosyltransferase TuaC
MSTTLESGPVREVGTLEESKRRSLRVLWVVPFSSGEASMIFIKRQISSITDAGAIGETFFLRSRTSPLLVIKEGQRLRRLIRSFHPDVVHAHFGTVTALMTVLSTSLPVVVTYYGSDLNPWRSRPRLRSPIGRLFSQIAALRARRIICISNQLRSRLWWRRAVVTVIPVGVDTSLFYPRPREEARREMGWGADERVVFFNAGRDPRVKRLDLAQAAVEVAERLCGKIRFVKLDGSVRPDVVPTIMNACDCLLVTSDWEGGPAVIQEAVACCLPVVSVDVGDVKELLSGIEPTRIVARNPEAIGCALSEILVNGGRSNGLQRAAELSTAHIADSIVSVYEGAVAGNLTLP